MPALSLSSPSWTRTKDLFPSWFYSDIPSLNRARRLFYFQLPSLSLYLPCTTFFVVYRKHPMSVTSIKYRSLEEFVNETRASGRYSFSWEGLKQNFDLSDKALNQALFRLKQKGKIARVRKGFYAIITPEYSKYGMLPPHLFIDDLMKSVNKPYYVALFSAAALHGAAHQQPMEYYVITEKPALRDIRSDKLKVNFYVKKDWVEKDIVQRKTDAGFIQVSCPELTALDLLTYGNFSINRVFTILEELIEEMKAPDLTRAARNYSQKASVQRLGYLMDKEIRNEKLSAALKRALKDDPLFPVPLLKSSNVNGRPDPDWKVIKNVNVESDL